jgi:nucleotide-binding universal stress UspA family protein
MKNHWIARCIMVPEIKKILHVSDLSEYSIAVLEWTVMLAYRHDAQITVLHVIEDAYPQTAKTARAYMGEKKWQEMSMDYHAQTSDQIRDRVNRFCQDVISEMDSCQWVVSDIVVSRGVPVEIIFQEFQSQDYDLITMGAWGPGVFRDARVGRTARNLLRRTRCPVFVIPPPNYNGVGKAAHSM